MVFSTPNAFRFNNVINTLKGFECINTDHRYWFTPYTLSKVLTDSGYKIDDVFLCEHSRVNWFSFFKKIMIETFPVFRDTLIIVASPDCD